MDGYHLCKRVKDDQDLKSIPVVLFSSLITDKLFHKGEAVGADGQFSKPDLSLIEFHKGSGREKKTAGTIESGISPHFRFDLDGAPAYAVEYPAYRSTIFH